MSFESIAARLAFRDERAQVHRASDPGYSGRTRARSTR
jgi:hypothetical protein